jgi:hypothetical protein
MAQGLPVKVRRSFCKDFWNTERAFSVDARTTLVGNRNGSEEQEHFF